MYCSGVEKMDVRGMNGRVLMPQKMDIWKCCSGVEKMGVRGMQVHVAQQQNMDI
jgi:hypothetical protein